MTRLGVLGWPVGHSRSPAIQNAALRACGLAQWRYQRLPVPPQLFSETVGALPSAGFRGVNVTLPYKQGALALSSAASPRASSIGAANTLTFDGTEIHADNTDAPALIAALPRPVAGQSALVLGAGGSARAAVWALLDGGAAEVRVWNRTAERAQRLCAGLGAVAVAEITPADLLVHCTSSGLDASRSPFDDLPLSTDDLTKFGCVVDFVYSGSDGQLIQAARSLSIPAVGGLELLVGQGALSFERFTGLSAPVEEMRAAVRDAS